jgi:hypothetical protein
MEVDIRKKFNEVVNRDGPAFVAENDIPSTVVHRILDYVTAMIDAAFALKTPRAVIIFAPADGKVPSEESMAKHSLVVNKAALWLNEATGFRCEVRTDDEKKTITMTVHLREDPK